MLRPGVREYFRLRPRGRKQVASQVDEEIDLHIEYRARELESRGMDAGSARAEAERRFGGLTRARLKLQHTAQAREYRMSVREWVSSWGQDVRFSARSLGREPLLLVVIVFTLALGIGANAVMFGIVDRLLLRGPEHVVAPEQVRRFYTTQERWTGVRATAASTGYVVYSLLRERDDVFAGAGAYRVSDARLDAGLDAQELRAGWASWDLFPLLGVKPALGRFYTEDEDRPKDVTRVAVLDYGFWQSKFGGARDVLGRTLVVDDEKYTIIGVAPRGFTGPELEEVNVWLPVSAGYEPHPEWPTSWNVRWLYVVVRPAPGVTWEQATVEASRTYRAAVPPDNRRAAEAALSFLPLSHDEGGSEPTEFRVSRWLAGVSLVVLLVACANVTNLLLARALKRRREVAIRRALGVSGRRLARLLLTDGLLLAAVSGAAALLLAYWGGQVIRAALLPDVQWGAPVDGRILLFSLAICLATAAIITLAPMLQTRSQQLHDTLKSTTRQAGAYRSRLRGGLTVLQAAFSLVLLIGAGLFVRSLWNVRNVDLGVEPDRVLAVWSNLGNGQQREFRSRAVERLRARPDVEHAALALGAPLQGGFGVDLFVPGYDSLPTLPGGGPYITAVGDGYFKTVGTRILRGRGIEPGEGKGTEPVAIVSESMARVLWPGQDALTKCIIVGAREAPCARVVGIAQDVNRWNIREEPSMQYYIPLGQEQGIGGTQLLVRPRGPAAAFTDELRQALHELAPGALYFDISPMQDAIDPQVRPWRLGATMFLVFGGIALLIAAVGLYSVIGYAVAQRRVELGVRMALGARARSIVGMVLRQGVTLVIAGVLVGLLLAVLTGRFLESLLFEVSPRDPATLAGVSAALLLVAVIAAVVPAARAGRTNPVDALRND